MEYSYVWEKFHGAVLGLSCSVQSLQDRLDDAYLNHLVHAEDDGLPEEIREDFRRVKKAQDRSAAAPPLSDHEARLLIQLVVVMYDKVTKYGPAGQGE